MITLSKETPILDALIVTYYPTYEAFANDMGMGVGELLDKLDGEQDWMLKEIRRAAVLLKIPAENLARVFVPEAEERIVYKAYHQARIDAMKVAEDIAEGVISKVF